MTFLEACLYIEIQICILSNGLHPSKMQNACVKQYPTSSKCMYDSTTQSTHYRCTYSSHPRLEHFQIVHSVTIVQNNLQVHGHKLVDIPTQMTKSPEAQEIIIQAKTCPTLRACMLLAWTHVVLAHCTCGPLPHSR